MVILSLAVISGEIEAGSVSSANSDSSENVKGIFFAPQGERFFNSYIYQPVCPKLKFTIRTSRLTPATSCIYHNGKVSLSPYVKTIASFSKLCNTL